MEGFGKIPSLNGSRFDKRTRLQHGVQQELRSPNSWHLERSSGWTSDGFSGPLRLRVQLRSRTRLRIAASIAFLFRACFKVGEHQLGYGICRCWDLQFLVSPVFSSMSPCTHIPEHLMQVPDLIDFALPVLFGGKWHILHMSMRVCIQENSSHCPLQSKFDMRYEAMSLARILSSGLTCKIPFFGLLFVRPENIFFGPPILHIFALSAVSEECVKSAFMQYPL